METRVKVKIKEGVLVRNNGLQARLKLVKVNEDYKIQNVVSGENFAANPSTTEVKLNDDNISGVIKFPFEKAYFRYEKSQKPYVSEIVIDATKDVRVNKVRASGQLMIEGKNFNNHFEVTGMNGLDELYC